jgi:hypothetical protein
VLVLGRTTVRLFTPFVSCRTKKTMTSPESFLFTSNSREFSVLSPSVVCFRRAIMTGPFHQEIPDRLGALLLASESGNMV